MKGPENFANLPETVFFDKMRKHLRSLDGSVETGLLTDQVTEMWLDFNYNGHSFSINNQYGEYWFFVKDPICPDDVLTRVTTHFESLLDK